MYSRSYMSRFHPRFRFYRQRNHDEEAGLGVPSSSAVPSRWLQFSTTIDKSPREVRIAMSATLTDDRTTMLNSPNLEHSRQRSEDVLHSPQTPRHLPNAWSRSLAKRCFDALAVIVSLPLSLPLLVTIGICV